MANMPDDGAKYFVLSLGDKRVFVSSLPDIDEDGALRLAAEIGEICLDEGWTALAVSEAESQAQRDAYFKGR